MLLLKDFIKAIQDAVLAASDSLMQKNLSLMEEYFEKTGDTDRLQDALDNALKAAKGIVDLSRPNKDAFQKAIEAFETAESALTGDAVYEPETGTAKTPQALRPKVVKILYPDQTAKGMVLREVSVPLITLVPLSMSQITQVKFRTKLEIQESDGELKVSFPVKSAAADSAGKIAEQDTSNFGELEIIIEPHKGTSGLQKLVEGYEKVLRAQIPN